MHQFADACIDKAALSFHQQCLAIAREVADISLELRSLRSVGATLSHRQVLMEIGTMLAASGDNPGAVEVLHQCEARAAAAGIHDLQCTCPTRSIEVYLGLSSRS